jgi:hypothetical protein
MIPPPVDVVTVLAAFFEAVAAPLLAPLTGFRAFAKSQEVLRGSSFTPSASAPDRP